MFEEATKPKLPFIEVNDSSDNESSPMTPMKPNRSSKEIVVAPSQKSSPTMKSPPIKKDKSNTDSLNVSPQD